MPWSPAQLRAFAAKAHDPSASPASRKKFRKMEMESTHKQRSRAMTRSRTRRSRTRRSKRA